MKEYPSSDDLVATEAWYARHAQHVKSLERSSTGSYPPSGSDCSRPDLWKGAHWAWFEERRKHDNVC